MIEGDWSDSNYTSGYNDGYSDGSKDCKKINNFYPNCMELNGFKKTLVLYDVSSG